MTPEQGRTTLPRALRLHDLLTVRDHTDATGRLLLEDSAPKKARKETERAGVAMRTARCPYDDTPSRLGAPMNVSAYEALRRDTTEILNGFAWLAHRYLERAPAARGTVQGLTDTSRVAVTLPLVLFNRALDPVPTKGRLPSYIASVFKAARGILSAAVDMRAKHGPGKASAAEVVAFAEQHRHLIRAETGRTCAAPTKLIERTVAVILTGEGANPAASSLEQLANFNDVWNFTVVESAFSDACARYRAALEMVTGAVRAGKVAERDMLDCVIAQGGRQWTFGDFTEYFRTYANAVQSQLNSILGRAEDAPAITTSDLSRIL